MQIVQLEFNVILNIQNRKLRLILFLYWIRYGKVKCYSLKKKKKKMIKHKKKNSLKKEKINLILSY